jgi:hypothetical protein
MSFKNMGEERKLESWSDLVRAAKCKEDLHLPEVEESPREAILEVSRQQYENNQRGLAELENYRFRG